jgi:hypothetical protein
MLRSLTDNEIAKLTTDPSVKKIAVENFCGTMGGQTLGEATMNLQADAKAYKWNAKTVSAIRKGISMGNK